MLIVLSPAKTLDYDSPAPEAKPTQAAFIAHSAELIETLKRLSPAEIGSLMSISDSLAVLNADRFASWSPRFTSRNSRPAVFAFNGDVYEGLDARTLTSKQLDYAQAHLRILSGLYGVLRPLDLMQPYRLEMGTRLGNPRGKDLYAFWGTLVTDALNAELSARKAKVLVNLASEEYFKVVKPRLLAAPVITPVFEDWKGGRYKIISFHAKRARGLMARYAARKGITQPEKLKAFDSEGYAFEASASSDTTWVFRRRIEGQ
ncbi:MAG TPA: peroxide stress protein YaaA [Noviherbaspirillum sp.]|uniref:peroxide stress protein YaaA n=1 Tax=Noviherbaspirillum sp. TaxID=1926288 RepID=UPI002F946B08